MGLVAAVGDPFIFMRSAIFDWDRFPVAKYIMCWGSPNSVPSGVPLYVTVLTTGVPVRVNLTKDLY